MPPTLRRRQHRNRSDAGAAELLLNSPFLFLDCPVGESEGDGYM